MAKTTNTTTATVSVTANEKSTTIEGNYQAWQINGGNPREYITAHIPFGDFVKCTEVARYSASRNTGNQRAQKPAHVKKIRLAMEEGKYTPAPFSVNLTRPILRSMSKDIDKQWVSFEIPHNKRALVTDGGHRECSLSAIRADIVTNRDYHEDGTDQRAEWEALLDGIDSVPITTIIYLDGCPQEDFLNLQAGATVDATHMLSMSIQKKLTTDPMYATALKTAQYLLKDHDSPFANIIRLDTGSEGSLPFSTLCPKSSSDLSYSLLGLAKVGHHFADSPKDVDPEQLGKFVVDAYKVLYHETKGAPNLLESGMILANGDGRGTKGSRTMMVGVAIALAYRVLAKGNKHASAKDLEKLVEAAKLTMDTEIQGSFSVHLKRETLGQFVTDLFSGEDMDKVDGVPLELMEILSFSCYKRQKPASEKPAKRTRQAQKPNIPDVDEDVSPLPMAEIIDETDETASEKEMETEPVTGVDG